MSERPGTTPWTGYLRSDGRRGIRNLALVVYTVECARFVAEAIARDEEDTHVIGFAGCYDNAYAVRMLLALGHHPNVGAVLAVGLGCEYTQPARIAEVVRASGRPADAFFIQDAGGTRKGIVRGKQALEESVEALLCLLVKIAAGTPSKPEALGHRKYFIPYKHQDTPGLQAGCRA